MDAWPIQGRSGVITTEIVHPTQLWYIAFKDDCGNVMQDYIVHQRGNKNPIDLCEFGGNWDDVVMIPIIGDVFPIP